MLLGGVGLDSIGHLGRLLSDLDGPGKLLANRDRPKHPYIFVS